MVGFCEATVATVMGKDEDKSGYVDAGESEASGQPCVTCAHYRRRGGWIESSDLVKHCCERPQLGYTIDRVVGADIPNSRDAYSERAPSRTIMVERGMEIIPPAEHQVRCGPEGKFWARSGF